MSETSDLKTRLAELATAAVAGDAAAAEEGARLAHVLQRRLLFARRDALSATDRPRGDRQQPENLEAWLAIETELSDVADLHAVCLEALTSRP